MTVSSADPAGLDRFVHHTSTARRIAHDEQRSLARLQAAVDAASVGYGTTVPALVALDEQFVRMRDLERFVQTVRAELLAADRHDEFGRPSVTDLRLRAALDPAGPGTAPGPVEFEPGTLFGLPPTSGFVDDPICAANGNMVQQDRDLSFPGLAAALDLVRTYNSRVPDTGAFGRGYTSVLDVMLTAGPGRVEIRLPDGAAAAFVHHGGTWRTAGRRLHDLERHGTGWTIRLDHERTVDFDADGGLVGWRDGRAHVVVERSHGRIVHLTETVTGRGLELDWREQRVVRARCSDGATVTYEYDGDRLVRVDAPAGPLVHEWDGDRLRAIVDADGVRPFENEYDGDGRVTRQRSPFGRVTTYRYGDGLTVVSGDDGVRQGLVHDDRGNLTAVVDADGSAMRITYDHADRATEVVARSGATWRHRFDDVTGDLVERIDPDGAGATWSWDELGRLVTETHRNGGVTRYAYRADLRTPVRITDPLGAVTTVEVDERLDLPTAVVDADGVTTRFEYDTDGRLTAHVDGLGGRTRFEYDPTGRLIRTVDPVGLVTTVDHDDAARPVRADVGGRVSTWSYTPAGRLVSGTAPAGAAWQLEYGPHGAAVGVVSGDTEVCLDHDAMGNLVAIVLPDGAAHHRLHDQLGQFVGTADPSGATTHLHHDVDGRVVEVADGAGRCHRRELDALGRTVRSTGPDGATTSWTYHPGGQVAAVTLPDGRIWRGDVDRAGRLVAVTDPAGWRTELDRSPAGRVLARRTPSGHEERFDYDAAGRLAATVDAAGRRRTIERDAAGRIVRVLDGDRILVELERDRFGTIVRRVELGIEVTFDHDRAGRLTSWTDATGVRTAFEWDPDGLVTAVVDPSGGRTTYARDTRGRIAAVTTPGDRTTVYGYDPAGWIDTIVDPVGATTRLPRDPTGIHLGVDRDGIGWRRELDAAGRETRRIDLDGQVLGEFSHDVAGRLVRAATPTWSTGYEWDEVDRLRRIADPAWAATIARDPDGRAVVLLADGGDPFAVTDPDPAGFAVIAAVDRRDPAGRLLLDRDGTAYSYDGAGRLRSVEPPDGAATSYDYGADGLVVTEHGPGGVRRFTHDPAGRVSSITSDVEGTTRFEYDRAGRRTAEVHPDGTVRRFRWDGTDRLVAIETVPADGTPRTTTIEHDAFGRPCRIDGRDIGRDPLTGDVDHIGDTHRPGPADEVWEHEQPEWQPARAGVPDGLRLGALTFLGARVHDAVTGQFLTPDPLPTVPGSNGSASPHTYAWLDPVNHLDPSGLRPISVAEFDAIRAREESGRLGMAWEAIVDDPWGSLAMAGVVVVGVALVATGAGAAVGAGILVGAGITAGVGVATGTFDPRQVALGGVAGGLTLGVGTGSTAVWSAGRTMLARGAIGTGQSVAGQVLAGGPVSLGDAVLDGALGVATAGVAGRTPSAFRTSASRAFVTDSAVDAAGSALRQRVTGDGSVSIATTAADGLMGGTVGRLEGGFASRGVTPVGPVGATPAVPATTPLPVGPPPAGPTVEMAVVHHATDSVADLAIDAEIGAALPSGVADVTPSNPPTEP